MHAGQKSKLHEAENEVLLHSHAQAAVAGFAGDLREVPHLRTREVALIDPYRDHRIAGLFLFLDVRFKPAIELRVSRRTAVYDREQRTSAERQRFARVSAEAFR